jgi:hypothetical protein
LKSKSYDKLFEFFFGDQCLKNKRKFIEKYGTESLVSFDLIHCTVQYLRGNFEDCVKILENPKTELEMVFGEYVKLYLDRFKYLNDPTTLVKKFNKIKMRRLGFGSLNSVIKDTIFINILIFYIVLKKDIHLFTLNYSENTIIMTMEDLKNLKMKL